MTDTTLKELRYTLIQCRNHEDPMVWKEVKTFADVLGIQARHLNKINLVDRIPTKDDMENADIFLVGGSGDYGVLGNEPWLEGFFSWLRLVCERKQPLFCSCYGFQALTVALGGEIVNDPENIEIGTIEVNLTEEGRQDDVFGKMPKKFPVQIGHKDRLKQLPGGVVHLVSGVKAEYEAFRVADSPIYATQFHPELDKELLIERVMNYVDDYAGEKVGQSLEDTLASLRESPDAGRLLPIYIDFLRRNRYV